MQYDYTIKEITEKQDAAFDVIKELFEEMYAYMCEHGLKLELAEDGAQKWIKSVQTGLGRFGTLYVCEVNGAVKGFAHGSIRLSPDYLGSQKLGVVTHIHVSVEYRGSGAGSALLKSLERWFRKNNVASIELQVLVANEAGVAFWEKQGYSRELLQYRKMQN